MSKSEKVAYYNDYVCVAKRERKLLLSTISLSLSLSLGFLSKKGMIFSHQPSPCFGLLL
jgi:hypothetical protein